MHIWVAKLINRLQSRNLSEEETNRRISHINKELEYKEECDHVIPFGSIDFMYSMLKKAIV